MAWNWLVGFGHHDWLDMGRHGVGALLELGSERGVGVGDADAVCAGASNAPFPSFSTAAFLGLLMTYFGVNFWLGGLHAYA